MSYGGLVAASEQMELDVRNIDKYFSEYHRSGGLQHNQHIRRRTIDFILSKPECQHISRRAVEIFVKIKVGHRITNLNNMLSYSASNAKNPRDLVKTKHQVF